MMNDDTFRNVELDGNPIIEAIEQLQEDVEDLQEDVGELQEDIKELKPIKDHIMIGSFYGEGTIPWYHVDNVYGDNSYDGTEWTHTTGTVGPLQTIEKAIELANKSGRHDVRIALVASETPYTISAGTIACQCLHIYGCHRDAGRTYITSIAEVEAYAPVKLVFTNTARRTALYATHCNFHGLAISKSSTPATSTEVLDQNREIYSDGGMVLFEACALGPTYTQNGGTLWLNDVVLKQLICRACNTWNLGTVEFSSSNTGMRQSNNNGVAVPYYGGDRLVVLAGTFQTSEANCTIKWRNSSNQNEGRFCRLSGCQFYCRSDSLDVGTTLASHDILIDNSICYMPSSARAEWQKPEISDAIIFSGNAMVSGSVPPQSSFAVISKVAFQSSQE